MKHQHRTILFLVLFFSIARGFSQNAWFDWAVPGGNPSYGEGNIAVKADGSGGCYVAGDFMGTAAFGIHSVTSSGGLDIFLARFNGEGEIQWLHREGGSDNDYLQSLDISEAGDIYLSGYYYGTTIIGSDVFTSSGSQDIFLACFGDNGNCNWAVTAGGVMSDYISGLAVDSEQNIWIAGEFYGDIQFGGSQLTSTGLADIFLAKYSPSGSLLKLVQAGGSSVDAVSSLCADATGHLLLSGAYFTDFTMGDTTLTTTDPTAVFLARISNAGALGWITQLGGNSLDAASFAAADQYGMAYLAGNFQDTVHIGSYTFVSGAFNQDVYVAKFTPEGDVVWADQGGGEAGDDVVAAATDGNGNLYLAGHYMMDITFGNITLPYTLCCGSLEIYTVRYGASGIPDWGKQLSGVRACIRSISTYDNNSLFAGGLFQGSLTYGNDSIQSNQEYNDYLAAIRFDPLTGTDEGTLTHTLGLYPNPASGAVNITAGGLETATTLQVFDHQGRKLISRKIPSATNLYRLDISGLRQGIYPVVLRAADGRVSTGKLLVK
jgi:hypothetical protein